MPIADLVAACDRLAESTSSPVVLEDAEYRVLAYSAVPGQVEDPARAAAILQRRTPDAWLQWIAQHADPGAMDDGSLRVVADPWPGLRRRAIKALRFQGEVIGYLWLLEGERGFPSGLDDAIRRFEANVVPQVAAEAASGAWGAEHRFVRQAVEGSLTSQAAAAHLGVAADAAVVVTCYLLPGDGFTPLAGIRPVLDAVRSRGNGERVAMVGSSVARIDTLPSGQAEGLPDTLWRSAHALQRVAGGPVFAVTSDVGALGACREAWEDATSGAEALRELAVCGRYASFDAVRVLVALRVLRRSVTDHRRLFDALLEPLAGAGRAGELTTTLATMLREEGSVTRVATRLRLHPNSVRYRAERIREVLGPGYEDPDVRLVLRLATWRPDEMTLPGQEL